jgi:hypothetical protein
VVGPPDGSCPDAFFSRVQSAIDAAVPGTTIVLCRGTYPEQLLVTKRVRLIGLPGARLVPPALPLRTTSLRSGRTVTAAVILRAPAKIEGLAIDASNHGIGTCDGAAPLLAGIYVRGVAATISGTSVTGLGIPGVPADCASGVGVLVHGGGAARVRIEGNSIGGYQRAGIVVQDSGVRATIRENLVTGDGDTPDRLQNGIEVANGAAARIEENVVRDHAGPSGTSCQLDAGIVVDTGRVRVLGNQLERNAVGIRAASRGHLVRDNAVTGAGLIGLDVGADESRVLRNTIEGVASAGIRIGGNRSRLRDNVVSAVHAASGCEVAKEQPGCEAALARCGTGVWLLGRANQVSATLVADVDVTVTDDGVGNVVR